MENIDIGVQFLAEARHILFSTASTEDLRPPGLLSYKRVRGSSPNAANSR
jgi:hypothetical protein